MRRIVQALALGIGGALVAQYALQHAATRNARRRVFPGDAPPRTARRWFGDYVVTGRTVTINKPRAELYAYWRNFENLATFMENIERVRTGKSGTTVWTISAPAGNKVSVETCVVEERPDELIAWRSTPKSEIDTEGRIVFRDAPAGRGTEVEAIIAYKPPAGELGRLVAKLFQREPSIQGRRELRRFKMLMETGEVATSQSRRPPVKLKAVPGPVHSG